LTVAGGYLNIGAGAALMSMSQRDIKMLWGAAASRCSFPKCARRLVAAPSPTDPAVILGEMAHIVGESSDGPRGQSSLTADERNKYENLILLCEEHHKLVDGQPNTYSVEVLHRYKKDHELLCQRPFDSVRSEDEIVLAEACDRQDRLHATLLPVAVLPRYVYSAECLVDLERTLKEECVQFTGRRPPAFIIRGKQLLSFDGLKDLDGPFARWVKPDTSVRLIAAEMWDDPDLCNYYVTLLNRILRKLAGARGLELDMDHHRWFFPPGAGGSDAEKEYTPLNRKRSARNVAWRPMIRATGEKRSTWEHLAIGMRFYRVTDEQWVLAIRPERHFTKDGRTPLAPKTKGRRATKRAARLYNFDLLEDANFWRSYLSKDEPRIIWKVGRQSLVIEAKLVDVAVSWPGVPDDFKGYANVQADDDLFTHAALQAALGDEAPNQDEYDEDEDSDADDDLAEEGESDGD
jgi:hypothetical protein